MVAALHPVKFPLLDLLQHDHLTPLPTASTAASVDVTFLPSSPTPCITLSVTTLQQRDLADTGASAGATGMKEILHNFTDNTRYEITGYDGQVTRAAGEGYAHVRNNSTQTVDKILFVYSPTITGTIFSLEHYAQTHPLIHKCWTQEAIPSMNGGWIVFFDQHQQIVSRYPTVRSKGVYFIQDMQFVPSEDTTATSPDDGSPVVQEERDTSQPPGAVPASVTPSARLAHFTVALLEVFSHPDQFDGFQGYMTVPSSSSHCSMLTAQPPPPPAVRDAAPALQAILQFEIWHQRLGHCSEQKLKLKLTQQHVDGIPKFTARVSSVVRCRACDIAKLHRAQKGPSNPTPDLQPGQVFQMDIGFFRGPQNLQEVYDRAAVPQPKLIESRQGFVCYLLIVDRATRYIWIFPLRSKSVSLTMIDLLLRTHGLQVPRMGTKVLRTDGECSLAESTQFRVLLLSHGYLPEKTATDTSSQNGLAERHEMFEQIIQVNLL